MGQNLDGAGKGPGAAGESDSQASSMSCDFCGAEVAHVRRIALDEGYDRLHARHVAKYACPDCSEVKERERLGG
ncbi:hypothetical protein MK489_15890 [Myxococcota bacterium]|nr:hypothetical protein [Myxococcota bacterium]